MPKHLILASTSPRRQEILRGAGIEFTVATSDYEEDMTQDMPPIELVKELAKGKALAVASDYPNDVVLAADTIVAFEGRVLGKPKSTEGIIESLTLLNGKKASTITGFAVVSKGKIVTEAITADIFFRHLTKAEISAYAMIGEGLDKAGGFGIQGVGALLFDKIEGDYFTIVGLPVSRVAQVLATFDVETPLSSR